MAFDIDFAVSIRHRREPVFDRKAVGERCRDPCPQCRRAAGAAGAGTGGRHTAGTWPRPGFSTADSAATPSREGPRPPPAPRCQPGRSGPPPAGHRAAAPRGGCAPARPGKRLLRKPLPAQRPARSGASPLRPRIALRAAGFSCRPNKTLPRGCKAQKREGANGLTARALKFTSVLGDAM